MAEYLIVVEYDRNKFPPYERLVQELEQVPNSVVFPIDYDFGVAWLSKMSLESILKTAMTRAKFPVGIIIYEITGDNYKPLDVYITFSTSKKVEAFISLPQRRKVGEATVSNNGEAISKLVYFTGYVLSQITNSSEYIIPREAKEDIRKISIKYINVDEYRNPKIYEEMKTELKRFGCNLTKIYSYDIIYEYPYRMRRVIGAGYCCDDKLFALDGMVDSEHGKIPAEALAPPYNPKFETAGCTKKDVENTLKQHVLHIELFIREVLFNKE